MKISKSSVPESDNIACVRCQTVRLSRNEFAITETELKLIAAAAIIGESKSPIIGYRTPAAIGTPAAL